jgi:hypothetical protein
VWGRDWVKSAENKADDVEGFMWMTQQGYT